MPEVTIWPPHGRHMSKFAFPEPISIEDILSMVVVHSFGFPTYQDQEETIFTELSFLKAFFNVYLDKHKKPIKNLDIVLKKSKHLITIKRRPSEDGHTWPRRLINIKDHTYA